MAACKIAHQRSEGAPLAFISTMDGLEAPSVAGAGLEQVQIRRGARKALAAIPIAKRQYRGGVFALNCETEALNRRLSRLPSNDMVCWGIARSAPFPASLAVIRAYTLSAGVFDWAAFSREDGRQTFRLARHDGYLRGHGTAMNDIGASASAAGADSVQ